MRASAQRLCVNIDHVATLRQARGGRFPDPVEAAAICERAGADGITAHLREDRRHIQDDDVTRLRKSVSTYFNLEIACTDEMLAIAQRLRPDEVTLVPERREEITTEGGLDVSSSLDRIRNGVEVLKSAGIRSSLFIAPDERTVRASKETGADAVELHTGEYSHAVANPERLNALRDAAALASSLGLHVNAGHGLDAANVGAVAAIPEIEELNIGHWIVSRAVAIGLPAAIAEIRNAMNAARA